MHRVFLKHLPVPPNLILSSVFSNYIVFTEILLHPYLCTTIMDIHSDAVSRANRSLTCGRNRSNGSRRITVPRNVNIST